MSLLVDHWVTKAHVAKFYDRLRLIRSVLRASKYIEKSIGVVILWVITLSLFASACLGTSGTKTFQLLNLVYLYARPQTGHIMVWFICPSIRVSICPSVTVLRTFLLHSLRYWAEIMHRSFFFTLLQIKFGCSQFSTIFVGVMPLFELKILEIHSFPQFSPTCSGILSWNFIYDLHLR